MLCNHKLYPQQVKALLNWFIRIRSNCKDINDSVNRFRREENHIIDYFPISSPFEQPHSLTIVIVVHNYSAQYIYFVIAGKLRWETCSLRYVCGPDGDN